MPGAGRGRVPQVKLNISLPKVLADRIEELIHRDGSANSVPDFVRQAAVKEVERRLGDHEVVDEGAEKTLKRTKAV